MSNCPVCTNAAEITNLPGFLAVGCPNCGRFKITRGAYLTLRKKPAMARHQALDDAIGDACENHVPFIGERV